MSVAYQYVKAINTNQLLDEIVAVSLPLPYPVETVGTDVVIYYDEELTVEQKAALDEVIAAHIANASYVPAATQAQINTLLGHLNNANTTIAATARMIIVKNIAPRMAPGVVETINQQIATALGE